MSTARGLKVIKTIQMTLLQLQLHRSSGNQLHLDVAYQGPDLQNILRFLIRLSYVCRKRDLR